MNLSDQETSTRNDMDNQSQSSQEDVVNLPPSTSATSLDNPSFGWSAYAERINGRFAMIGFTALLLIEAFSNDSFLHWSGLIR